MDPEELANAQASIPAMFLTNAVMLRALLHIFVINAGTRDEQRQFQQDLFAKIMKDIAGAPGEERIREMARVQVRAIFGLDANVAKN